MAETESTSMPAGLTRDPEMAAVGYVIGAGILIIALPLLPFVALVWLLSRGGRNSSAAAVQ